MTKRQHRSASRSLAAEERICEFKLNDLVRVDFVFPYGRVAASRDGIIPEPFDRDAPFAADPEELSEIKDRIIDLFRNRL